MGLKRSFIAAALVGAALAIAAPAPSQAIVGGSNSAGGAHPFMASLQSGGTHRCGGSVIANEWVLTAAHCVDDGVATGLTVRVGSNTNNAGGTVIAIDEVRLHPQYDGRYFDAALLKLHTPTSVPKITLANAGDDNLEANGTPVTVVGWGDITPVTLGLLAGPQLKEVALKVVNDSTCHGDATGVPALTTVCAGALLKDSCQGDSGGPLFWKSGATRIQIGIVSHGLLCAIPQQPGRYSEVNNSSIRDFIHLHTGV